MGQDSRGAETFARMAWGETYRCLAEIPRENLDLEELERLAVASYMTGEDDAAVAAWEEAHRRYLSAGERPDAARCSFWAAFCLMVQGQTAHAGGWLSRTEGVIGDVDCPARGYLLMTALLRSLDAGNPAEARDLAAQAAAIADRFDDRDLRAFSKLGGGQALLALGDEAAGMAMFDEVMLSVSSGEVGPITSGIVYCAVILECMQLFDLARAKEWTAALEAWCEAQSDLVPYRGQCLVHQSQLQQAAGDWRTAVATVDSACDRLHDPPHPALGLACYQRAEMHRLIGEFDAAAAEYRRASGAGYEPVPGLGLLEHARGNSDAAVAYIRRALDEVVQPFQRPGLLAAAVEIFIAGKEITAAAASANELAEISVRSESDMIGGMAEHATGSVLLAEGDAAGAMAHLREARSAWQRLNLPYEMARTAVLLGQGCLALNDHTSAELEFGNAQALFRALGAQPDLERLKAVAGSADREAKGGLSAREIEVLSHVAKGKTNREIAEIMTISQHTVGRHLENIYNKLGVSGRAAVTAYAYEHDLL